MADIDYGDFLTPPPPRVSGRKMLYDTFAALAEAKRKRDLAAMEDERLRRANDLTFTSSMYGHDITAQHNLATEAGAAEQRTETGRHNLATEGNAAAALEQKKQEALSKLFADKDFMAALRSGDPNALAQWGPVMQANGITVKDVMEQGTGWQEGDPAGQQPTGIAELDEPVDSVSGPTPQAQAPTPTGRKQITGSGGLSYMFDPATNAIANAEAGKRLAGSMTEAATSMGPQSAEGTRDAAELARMYVARGMDPVQAGKLAGQQAVALAGQASSRRNADVAGARALAVKPSQAADDKRADVNSFGNDVSRWEKAANVDKLTDDFDRFTGMMANVQNYRQQGDTVGLKGALYGAARYITGPGVLTKEEYANTVTNTAGWTAALATKVQQGLAGKISDAEYAALERFVDNAQKTIKARALRALRTYDQRYSGNSYHGQKVPEEVTAYRNGVLQRFGLTAADVPPQPGKGGRDKIQALKEIADAIKAARGAK